MFILRVIFREKAIPRGKVSDFWLDEIARRVYSSFCAKRMFGLVFSHVSYSFMKDMRTLPHLTATLNTD